MTLPVDREIAAGRNVDTTVCEKLLIVSKDEVDVTADDDTVVSIE